MSITSRIRKSRIVVTTLLFVFVVGFFFPYIAEVSNSFFASSKINVGTIAGHKIPFHPDYRVLYEQMLMREIQESGHHYEGIEGVVHRKAWQKLISQHAFKGICDGMGIEVSDEERIDMILGHEIPKEMRGYSQFQDPQTKAFDRERYIRFWQEYTNHPMGKQMTSYLEQDLILSRRQEKLQMMVSESIYQPRIFKKITQNCPQQVRVRVLFIPYASIADSEVRNMVTPEDTSAYYEAHKEDFKVEKEESSKHIRYVQIPILHDEKEINVAKQELELLRERLLKLPAKDVEAFAKEYSDTPEEIITQWSQSELPQYLKDALIKAKKERGSKVVGPIREGNAYVLYRYIGVEKITSWTLKEEKIYRFIKIVRTVDRKGLSKNRTFTQASNFVKNAKAAQNFKKVAEEDFGYLVQEEELTRKEATQIGQGPYRKLFRWVFSDAKIGDISAPIEVKDNFYIVAMVTGEQKVGFRTLKQATPAIKTKLFNAKKAAKIKEKVAHIPTEGNTLYEIKKMYGSDAFIAENRALTFDNHEITKGHVAPRAIGVAFSLGVGERSQWIEEDKYMILVECLPTKREKEPPSKSVESEQDSVQKEQNRAMNAWLHPIKIDDNRFNFYD